MIGMALPLGAGKRMSIQKDLMFELQAREDVACAFLVKCKFVKVCPIHEEVYGAGGEGEDLIVTMVALSLKNNDYEGAAAMNAPATKENN